MTAIVASLDFYSALIQLSINHQWICFLLRRVSHGKLQRPCTPWKLLPGSRDLVDGKALALARHPQEQEYRLQPAGQQSLAAPPRDHRKLCHTLFLFCW